MVRKKRVIEVKKRFSLLLIIIISMATLIISMGIMYYFSSQNGIISSQQSNIVIEIVDKIREEIVLEDERLISIKEKLFSILKNIGSEEYLIRKGAHILIYTSIGIAMASFIYILSRKVFISSYLAYILATMYACYDEYRQLSIEGREGSFQDILIDSMGALVGIWIFIFIVGIFNIIRKINKKEEYTIINHK